ncbi:MULTISPECIES: DUF3592 domain-containing protein [Thiorhodovibrio]|uniref:DUF3592 domain-containing protein n=1 Tax=Thiorhodovibrio TaxID=61593 RepID=UPI001914907D|nr:MULTISPECIES: DUF3592 domain-containing protein [Thiorhodovibrio]MBK5971170.1 hypothetical protein [Thiorhodovibrio winogradskyi]WPL12287.1 Inner membrane protein YmfA [Thiorhodovibrio litoralis]WPL13261.1 Inner membrane protein YmfA [Thiorhodovibrio litoralis]
MKMFGSISILFALIGLVLLAIAAFAYDRTTGFIDTALSTTGTVVELTRSSQSGSSSGGGSTYRPVVRFQDRQGTTIEFVASVGSNPPSHRPGETVEVLYPPDDPHKATLRSVLQLWFTEILLGGLGSLFLLIGLGFSLPLVLSRRRRARLHHTGKPVQTTVTDVHQDSRFSARGRHAYRITTQWQNPRTGKVHVFTSEPVWFDPTDYLNRSHVTVLIDPERPNRYAMDLSFLPEPAN